MIRIHSQTPKAISMTLRLRTITLLAVTTAFEPSMAWADSTPGYVIFSDKYRRCLDKSFYTTEIRDCTAAENRRAGIRMDMAYRKAMAALPPDRKKALRQSQAKWQKRIKIECDNDPRVLSVDGGTLWPIFYTECFITRTKDRTKWIKKRYPWVAR